MRDDQLSYLLAVCNQLVSPTLLLLAVVLSAPYRLNLECKPLLKGIFRSLPREQPWQRSIEGPCEMTSGAISLLFAISS